MSGDLPQGKFYKINRNAKKNSPVKFMRLFVLFVKERRTRGTG